jgi:hypothetical protein
VLPLLVFSMSRGKHHHYMIHYMAPWAIFAALGLAWTWQKLLAWSPRRLFRCAIVLLLAGEAAVAVFGRKVPGPSWLWPALLVAWPILAVGTYALLHSNNMRLTWTGGFTAIAVLYALGFGYKGTYLHRSGEDTAFLREAREAIPIDQPAFVYSFDDVLEGFRMLFYCDSNTRLLHNLSFLRDERIHSPEVYVISRGRDLPQLQKWGKAEILLQSEKSRRETQPADRWSLFRVHLDDNVPRRPVTVRISPMQAMHREAGPIIE